MIVLFTVPRLLALLIVSRDMSGLLKAWKSKCWFIVGGGLLLICRRHYGMAFSTSAFLPFLRINCKNKRNIYSNSSIRASQAVL